MVPLWIRRLVASGLQHLALTDDYRGIVRRITQVVKLLTYSAVGRYSYWMEHFSSEMRQDLYTPAFSKAAVESNPEKPLAEIWAASETEEWVDRMLDADVNMYLPEDLLVKVDRATMAHSLEARSPFLDHVLMEFIATLPSRLKIAGKQQKFLLKTAFRGVLPDSVLNRPKMGFCVPLERWFREDLREMAYDVLLSPRAKQRGYFRPEVVSRLLDAHSRGEADHGKYLWDLLILELWHRTFLDGFDFGTNRSEDSKIQEPQLARS
jgi:asparagine synthase (glutamine-hydrolysing)